MIRSLISVSQAQEQLREHTRARRLAIGLTQRGLATRAGVSLPTLRKFEQKGQLSLESFLKLLMVLDGLERVVNAVKPPEETFSSMEEVLKPASKKLPKRGWRT